MPSEFELAINQICEEKGIDKARVISTIEAALSAAFRKDYDKKGQDIRVEFDTKTGASKVFEVYTVVEEVEDPKKEIALADAKKKKKSLKVGDEIKTDITPPTVEFGRIAAQTAKQVITQRIKEAERDVIFEAFRDKEGEVLTGTVQRVEGSTVFIDLGQTTGALFPSEQIRGEHYQIGQRLKSFIIKVSAVQKGPEILLSRSHPKLVEKLFSMEVPEISGGTVEIKSIAREAGSRTKIAVISNSPDVDPVGSCVGQRGTRVQAVISEINGEKIDITEWDENPVKFIANALSPAKVTSVQLDEANRHAKVEVPEDQLSLVIGREGQNVRLAVKLTGWKIDIVRDDGETIMGAREHQKEVAEAESKEEEKVDEPQEKEAAEKKDEKPVKEKKEKKKRVKKTDTDAEKEKPAEKEKEEKPAAEKKEENSK